MILAESLNAGFELVYDKVASPYFYADERARLLNMAQDSLFKEIFNDRVRDRAMNGNFALKNEDSEAVSIYMSPLYQANVMGTIATPGCLLFSEIDTALGNYPVNPRWNSAGTLAVNTPFTGMGGLVGTGVAGAILAGDYWTATATIVVGGVYQLDAGEIIYALKNTATLAADFAKFVPQSKTLFYPLALRLSPDAGLNYYAAREVRYMNRSGVLNNAFQMPKDCRPVYTLDAECYVLYPEATTFMFKVDALRRPRKIMIDETYPVNNVDCEMDDMLEGELIMRSMEFAGISIRDQQLFQDATGMTAQTQT